MIKEMDRERAAGVKVRYNREDWGYAAFDLQDVRLGAVKREVAKH
jgi:hypothetical protein